MFKTDIHTIFLILSLYNFLISILMFHLRIITKQKVSGSGYWAYGTLLSGIGMLFASFFQNDVSLSTEFFLSLGLNTFILSGDVLFIFGLQKFKNKALNYKYWFFPVLSVLNIITFTVIQRDIEIRFLVNAVLPAILYFLTAYEFLKPYRKDFRSSFVVAAMLFIFYGLIHIVRIITAIIEPLSHAVPNNNVTIILVLTGGLSMVLFTYILIVIITKTLTIALNEQIISRDKLHAIIAHDLRGPVGNLLNYTEVLKDSMNTWSKEQVSEWIAHMENAAAGSRFLLENLFHWSRSQLDEIKVNASDINLAEIVNQVIRQMKGQAENKNILLTLTDTDPVRSYVDPDMTGIVLRNLISNAIKFTPDGGRVIVSLAESVHHAEIIVSDNGTGMPKEKVIQLFNSSNYESTPGTKNEKGSGFGLLLCHDFVKLNNGEISVESETGKGSVFRIKLPKNGK